MKYLIIITLVISLCTFALSASENNVRVPRQAQQQHQQQNYQQPAVNYRPLSQAPAGIQQLLQLQQAREPLVHIPAQPVPKFGPAPSAPPAPKQAQEGQYRPNIQYGQAPQQPTYNIQPQPQQPRYQPQQPQYQQQQPQYQPQQPQYQPQYQQQQPQYQPQYNPAPQQQQQQPQYQG